MRKLLLAATLLAPLTAHADTIDGQLSIFGNDILDTVNQTIFFNSGFAIPSIQTGDFAGFRVQFSGLAKRWPDDFVVADRE